MARVVPHVRTAEILLLGVVIFLWGYWMLPDLRGAPPAPVVPEYRVRINRADWPELMNLPGIGEARAREIVRDRREHGPFRSPEELTRVPGIGPATVDGIRNHLRLE
jgi:competence ComEA-like helix-hairpin-helix protein